MKKNLIGLLFLIFVLIALVFIFIAIFSNKEKQVVCTEEAKICPDGSSVGRIAPDCEFAPCTGNCTCPQGYRKDGDSCNPECYYSNPPCLSPSIPCEKSN
jgi:hypothetical protein